MKKRTNTQSQGFGANQSCDYTLVVKPNAEFEELRVSYSEWMLAPIRVNKLTDITTGEEVTMTRLEILETVLDMIRGCLSRRAFNTDWRQRAVKRIQELEQEIEKLETMTPEELAREREDHGRAEEALTRVNYPH
jgi:hypothetical protein